MSGDFPIRAEAHISEAVSIEVLRECLPARWIFRPQASKDDYGIDAEIELVTSDGQVRGEIAKIQIKGQATVSFNGDGVAAVSGIKQSTLRYWLGLSKAANVILCVTDNHARQAYFAPVFWEATEGLDGTSSTRSIHFKEASLLKSDEGPVLFALHTLYRPWDVVRAHETLLRTMARTLHDFLWIYQADAWTIHDTAHVVKDWLRHGRSLFGLLPDEEERFFRYDDWCEESERDWRDSPMRGTFRKAYAKTFPLVFDKMLAISERVQRGSYYWSSEAPEYLELVESTTIPTKYDVDSIDEFVDTHGIRDPG